MIKDMGLNKYLYNTYSFHMGRALDLFKLGVAVEDIKDIGRWRSNAVYCYLRKY